MNHYSTDLTDNQWQVIEKFLNVQVRNTYHPFHLKYLPTNQQTHYALRQTKSNSDKSLSILST